MLNRAFVAVATVTLAALGITSPSQIARAEVAGSLHIDVDKSGIAIPPTFFGLMTEEINHSYDGGLYAELIQNRSFQDVMPPGSSMPVHWSLSGSGSAMVVRDDPVNAALPASLKVVLGGGTTSVANDGYWGIPVRPNTVYVATFYARGGDGFTGAVTASLVLDDGQVAVASGKTDAIGSGWKKYTVKLSTKHDVAATSKAHFVLSATGAGSVMYSYVSLFPPTYKNAQNGLRPDLMKLMADLRPAFIRLPGGNYLEGGDFSSRFNWKQMIGPPETRPGHDGCWGYRSSDGFGLPEFLLWCKQLDAEPVLGVFAGYVLSGKHVEPGSPEMAQYTQEALDEIEYITGSADSEWGRRRAADGFPEPFTLRYVEIGNEDWFDRSGSYDGRFTQMAKAIRARYPDLKIIATAPVKGFKPDLYDDHYYRTARQMLKQADVYDRPFTDAANLKFVGGAWNGRQPDGIKTFIGEWATQEGRPTPNLNAALGDAVFVMGMERNADAIPMQCYAPLLTNVNPEDPIKKYPKGWQWPTNLIGYDALNSFGSPSYYALAMLAQNKGDFVLPATLEVAPITVAPESNRQGCFGVATYHTQVEYKDIVVTSPEGRTLLKPELTTDIKEWKTFGGDWILKDGAIAPKQGGIETIALAGDMNWTDYTIQLKARKIAGPEGFIIVWHAKDGENYHWWNIGGWGNTITRCEAADHGGRDGYGPDAPIQIETNRWYDLKLEVKGRAIRGFIDGKLVTESTDDSRVLPKQVFAAATYSRADQNLIVKLVNVADVPVDMNVNLRGVESVSSSGTAIVLTGDPQAANTIDQPTLVSPRQETLTNVSQAFNRKLPPHSLTILRLNARIKQP